MTLKYPAIPDPTLDPASLRDSVLALKQAFEILTGQRGSGEYAALLAGDTINVVEEGEFTPSFTFTTPGNLSVTYAQQIAHYVRIGRVVIIWFSISTSAFSHTTASGSAVFSPLPYSPDTNTLRGSQMRGGAISHSGVTKAGYTSAAASTDPNGDKSWLINFSGSGVAQSTLSAADMPTGGTPLFRGTVMYIAL